MSTQCTYLFHFTRECFFLSPRKFEAACHLSVVLVVEETGRPHEIIQLNRRPRQNIHKSRWQILRNVLEVVFWLSDSTVHWFQEFDKIKSQHIIFKRGKTLFNVFVSLNSPRVSAGIFRTPGPSKTEKPKYHVTLKGEIAYMSISLMERVFSPTIFMPQ